MLQLLCITVWWFYCTTESTPAHLCFIQTASISVTIFIQVWGVRNGTVVAHIFYIE